MSIFDLVNSIREDRFKKDIKKLNISENTPAAQVSTEYFTDFEGETDSVTTGPFRNEHTDGRIIMHAIDGNMMYAFTGAFDWIAYEGRIDGFRRWFNSSVEGFIASICLIDPNKVKIMAGCLENYVPDLGNRVIDVLHPSVPGDRACIKKFLYYCIVIDIINGNVVDTYGLCNSYYNEVECRKILNDFPLRGKRATADDRSLNIAVAFWISCNADSVMYRPCKFSDNIEETYKELLKQLNYKDIKLLSKEDTCRYSGIDRRFVDSNFAYNVKDMCINNENAMKMIKLLKYIYANTIAKDRLVTDNVISTSYNRYEGDHHISSSYKICRIKLGKGEYRVDVK